MLLIPFPLSKKKPGETAQKALCYFTAEDGLNDTELGQRLREKLPDYMLPKLIKLLNPLPLLNNGKVDRQALLADYDSRSWLPDGYSRIFRIVCVWPFGLLDYGSATLRCKI